jgi:hypothetical protein
MTKKKMQSPPRTYLGLRTSELPSMKGRASLMTRRREDAPRLGGQWRKTPRWAAGGFNPPRPCPTRDILPRDEFGTRSIADMLRTTKGGSSVGKEGEAENPADNHTKCTSQSNGRGGSIPLATQRGIFSPSTTYQGSSSCQSHGSLEGLGFGFRV